MEKPVPPQHVDLTHFDIEGCRAAVSAVRNSRNYGYKTEGAYAVLTPVPTKDRNPGDRGGRSPSIRLPRDLFELRFTKLGRNLATKASKPVLAIKLLVPGFIWSREEGMAQKKWAAIGDWLVKESAGNRLVAGADFEIQFSAGDRLRREGQSHRRSPANESASFLESKF